VNYHVEGDWSGGAFLLVAGAISGNITITGLDMMSTQADKAIVEVLMSANAAIAIEAKGIKIHQGELSAFEFDATNCPDLFPPLVALAAYCNGTSRIKGVNRLRHKESDRAGTLKQEFYKMGVEIEISEDEMIIPGTNKITASRFDSHGDHRIAMACAVAALRAEGVSIIDNAKAVNKSYPDFFWHLKKLGADVTLDKMFIT
jgi:3-phosphoshikimate 1-carboxyvinyltransferase